MIGLAVARALVHRRRQGRDAGDRGPAPAEGHRHSREPACAARRPFVCAPTTKPTTPPSTGPDTAHHDAALRWLQGADASFLYLTGFSGTGKSSLLQAWLIPELAKGDPPTRTVVARSYADPLAPADRSADQAGRHLGTRARRRRPARALLERAAEKVRPARLLIAIDQFEECLILQDEAGREQLAALFRSIARAADTRSRLPAGSADRLPGRRPVARTRAAGGQERRQLVQPQSALARGGARVARSAPEAARARAREGAGRGERGGRSAGAGPADHPQHAGPRPPAGARRRPRRARRPAA